MPTQPRKRQRLNRLLPTQDLSGATANPGRSSFVSVESNGKRFIQSADMENTPPNGSVGNPSANSGKLEMQIVILNSILSDWRASGLLASLSSRTKANGEEFISINLPASRWEVANNELRTK